MSSREDRPGPAEDVVRRTPAHDSVTRPLVPPLCASAVYVARDVEEMDRVYQGEAPGFTYAREGSPNARQLGEKIARLEGAQACVITCSGMAAVSAIAIGLLKTGDHVVAGNQLYGRTHRLLSRELGRFGVDAELVDACDPGAVEAAIGPRTRMILVEVVSNPLLRVADVQLLGRIARERGVLLVVDNTFPTPLLLRPLSLGADIVFHSVTKMLGGHSDLTLGAVCCSSEVAAGLQDTVVTWGLNGSPFDCWLAERGLSTLEIRLLRAEETAARLADFLAGHDAVARVIYPGQPDHRDHAVARRLFGDRFGTMLTFELEGGRQAVDRLLRVLPIPFAPTLGDVSTIITHPGVTSHRGLTPDERAALGITDGMLRVSVGVERPELLEEELGSALQQVAG